MTKRTFRVTMPKGWVDRNDPSMVCLIGDTYVPKWHLVAGFWLVVNGVVCVFTVLLLLWWAHGGQF